MKFEIFKHSDKGPRVDNQDSLEVLCSDNLLATCLADGVGGSNCGGTASKESVSLFINELKLNHLDLRSILTSINLQLNLIQQKQKDCKGMATTFTGCYVVEDHLKGIHVGDSRLCVLRKNGIKQLTEDHTEANLLVKKGKLTFEEAKTYPRRHILESALNGHDDLEVQMFQFELEKGDRILLTTDGVHEIVTKVELRDLSLRSKSVESFGSSLLNILKSKKITDNYSMIIVEVF